MFPLISEKIFCLGAIGDPVLFQYDQSGELQTPFIQNHLNLGMFPKLQQFALAYTLGPA